MPQEPSPGILIAVRRDVPQHGRRSHRRLPPDRHTPGRSLPIRRRLPGGLVLAGRVTYDGAETGDGGGPWGTAGPPACFWHGVLRPPEEKAGRPEEAGTLPGMFDEERRSGRCPPRKAISD